MNAPKLKPGVKSSELWLTVGLGLITLGMSVADKLDGNVAAGVVTILGAVYTIARSKAKA